MILYRVCMASRPQAQAPVVAAQAAQSATPRQRVAATSGGASPGGGNLSLDSGLSTGKGGRQTFGGNDPLMENLGGGGASIVTGTSQTSPAARGSFGLATRPSNAVLAAAAAVNPRFGSLKVF